MSYSHGDIIVFSANTVNLQNQLQAKDPSIPEKLWQL